MKNLVFQVNIEAKESRGANKKRFVYGRELFDYSNKLAEEYAKKIDVDYFCLREFWNELGSEFYPTYHKIFVYELLKEYDNVFYVDSDELIHKVCPNIFETTQEFSSIRDNIDTPAGIKRNQRKNEIHSMDGSWKYFCAATILFNQEFYEKTKDHWKKEIHYCKNLKSGQHDQSLFNVLAYKYLGKYNVLGREWGTTAPILKNMYITHYGGPTCKEEWQRCITSFEKHEKKNYG